LIPSSASIAVGAVREGLFHANMDEGKLVNAAGINPGICASAEAPDEVPESEGDRVS